MRDIGGKERLMYHVVVLGLLLVMGLAMWQIVLSSPRALAYLLPPGPTFVVGAVFLILGVFAAFSSAYLFKRADMMIGSYIHAYIGMWLLLVRSDGETIKRAFVMMGTLQLAIVGLFYANDPKIFAIILMMMTAAGFWLTTNYLRFLDRGR
jgi:hypothetical protein